MSSFQFVQNILSSVGLIYWRLNDQTLSAPTLSLLKSQFAYLGNNEPVLTDVVLGQQFADFQVALSSTGSIPIQVQILTILTVTLSVLFSTGIIFVERRGAHRDNDLCVCYMSIENVDRCQLVVSIMQFTRRMAVLHRDDLNLGQD